MNENIWNEWRDFINQEFDCRLTAIGAKANRLLPGRKGLTALFLLVSDLGVSAADILPEVLKTVMGKGVKDTHHADCLTLDEDQLDTIAMMGHRIGLLENSDDLESYLQDAHELLKPKGQMLFTSLDMHAIDKNRDTSNPGQKSQSGRFAGEMEIQFQYGNLLGPFFGLFHLDTETLRGYVAATNWQYVVLQQQDDDNYIAWLRHEG